MRGLSIKNKLTINRSNKAGKENHHIDLGVIGIKNLNPLKEPEKNNINLNRRKSSCLEYCYHQRVQTKHEERIEKNTLSPFTNPDNKNIEMGFNEGLIGKYKKIKDNIKFNFDEIKQIYEQYMKKIGEYLSENINNQTEITQIIHNYSQKLIKNHKNIINQLKQTRLFQITQDQTKESDDSIRTNSQKSMLKQLNEEQMKMKQICILQKLEIQALNIKISHQSENIKKFQIRLRQLQQTKKSICQQLLQIQQLFKIKQNRDLQQKLQQYKTKEQKLLKMISNQKKDTSKEMFQLLKDDLTVSQSNFYMALKHFPSYKMELQQNYTLKGKEIDHFKTKVMFCYENNLRKINQFYASKRSIFAELAELMISNITSRGKIISNYFGSMKQCLTINK